jgi:hypothetical protein
MKASLPRGEQPPSFVVATSLLKCRVSDNVGGVKCFSSALIRALRRARPFALVEELPYQPRLARNRFRSGLRSDPCISSVATAIMITSSDSPVKGSGMPNQLLGFVLHTIAISGLSRVRTKLIPLLVIPPLPPHPIQTNRQPTSEALEPRTSSRILWVLLSVPRSRERVQGATLWSE